MQKSLFETKLQSWMGIQANSEKEWFLASQDTLQGQTCNKVSLLLFLGMLCFLLLLNIVNILLFGWLFSLFLLLSFSFARLVFLECFFSAIIESMCALSLQWPSCRHLYPYAFRTARSLEAGQQTEELEAHMCESKDMLVGQNLPSEAQMSSKSFVHRLAPTWKRFWREVKPNLADKHFMDIWLP